MARGDLAREMRTAGHAPDVAIAPSPAARLGGADLEAQAARARTAPRSIATFRRRIDEVLAYAPEEIDGLLFAKLHEGKIAHRPSARLAELLVYAYGNMRVTSHPTLIGRDFVEAEGVALDLETNTAHAVTLRRSLRRVGSRLTHEEILATATAAGTIARRNATLACIPSLIWAPILHQVETMIAGDEATLAERRDLVLQDLCGQGIELYRILRVVDAGCEGDIDRSRLVTLHGLAVALREGDVTPEEVFPPDAAPTPEPAGTTGFSADFVAAEIGDLVALPKPDVSPPTAGIADGGGEPAEEEATPAEAERASQPPEAPEDPALAQTRAIITQMERAPDEAALDAIVEEEAVTIGALPVAQQLMLKAHRVKRRRAIQAARPASQFEERKVA